MSGWVGELDEESESIGRKYGSSTEWEVIEAEEDRGDELRVSQDWNGIGNGGEASNE